MNWKRELRRRITRPEDLPFSLSIGEREFFSASAAAGRGFGFRATRFFASLAGEEAADPIRRQFVPTSAEFDVKAYELDDPLGEKFCTPVPRLLHRYRDRALLLVTDECALSCRYCFRRNFTHSGRGALGKADLAAAAGYLAAHREIKDLLLSGGDPLVLDDGPLLAILDAVRAVRPDLVVRIGSRIPAVLPSRITQGLVRGLRKRVPLWLVASFNHPRELSVPAAAALGRLVDAGIPVLSQTVLLRGINDEPGVLEDLFRGLVARRVKPYYMFQGDLAAGTSHFRVPLERGFALMKELRSRLSAFALPLYAVDLPGGGGKVPLVESCLTGEDGESWHFTSVDGKSCVYPKE